VLRLAVVVRGAEGCGRYSITARHRLPAVYAYNELVQVGGLMSFGPSYNLVAASCI
jgi:hypothetical protein